MSVYTAFQFEEGGFIPYDLPWASEQTWQDVLQAQPFRKEISMTLGRRQGGLRVTVHEAEHPESDAQEFAFLALVYVGESPHPIFCRDLPQLLQLLSLVVPIIEMNLKCVEEEASLEWFRKANSTPETPPTQASRPGRRARRQKRV